MPTMPLRHAVPAYAAALALATATLVAVPASAQAVPPTPVAPAAQASTTTFTASAPATVRTRDRFRVTGTVPRSFAGSIAVVELRQGSTWIPLQSAKVAANGRVGVGTQLSQRGSYRMRMRVSGKKGTALSQTLAITSRGGQPRSERPVRMLAHYAAQDDQQVQGSSLQPRAEDAAGLDAASEAASSAISVEALANLAITGGAGELGSFGVEMVLELMFPGEATATEAQIQQLESEVQQGFNNVYYDLQQLQDALNTVEAQNSEVFAEASLAACSASLNGLKSDVELIQETLLNYQDVMTETWGQENLSYSGGPANATVMGNYIFGVGSNATPSFGPGVNAVQVAVQDVEQAFTQTGPLNVINTCADAIAGYVIQQDASGVTSPAGQVEIGLLDNAYADLMQNLVGQYAAIINTGLALVGLGDFLAAVTLVPPSVTTVPQFLQACQDLDLFSCPQIAREIAEGQDKVSQMWHAGGASWGQVTNGTLQSDVYAYSGDTVFTNGANAWLTDITAFRNGTFGGGLLTGTPLSSTAVDTSSAVAGVSEFASDRWGPLVFDPATSDDFNGIIRTEYYPAPYPNAQGTILAACGGPTPLTNCSDTAQVGTHLGAAGLNNGGSPVSASDNLILYTGESYEWNPNYSAISPGLGFMGSAEGTAWNADSPVPNLEVASFLDTGMYPNRGVSAVVNDPGTYDFATGQGTIGNLTLGDVFPFSTDGNNKPGPGVYAKTSVTLQNYSGGYNLVAIPCSSWAPVGDYATDGGNWTVMDWMAPGNGTTNDYGNGCGWTRYYPDGGAPATSLNTTQLTTSTTALPDFYVQPQLNVVGVGNSGAFGSIQPCSMQWNCSSIYDGGWNALPGFVMEIGGNPVELDAQEQYLWPVVPTSSSNLETACPTISGGTVSNVTQFSQGNTSVGLPQTCLTLFDEWIAVAAGQDVGPISIQVTPQTLQPSGGYLASVSFYNSSDEVVQMTSGFVGAADDTVSAAPFGAGVQSCVGEILGSQPGYLCSLSLAPGTTVVSVPLTFASGATTGSLVVAAASPTEQYVAGASALVTTAPALSPSIPFGVTGLSATINDDALNPAGGGLVTLGWNEPFSVGAITSYVVTATGPAGSVSIDDTIPVSQITVQSNGQLSTQVNISQGGPWTFTVAAMSSAGVGPPDTLEAYLGNAPPMPPRNVAGRELFDGQVALSWQPSVASPAVQFYTVTWWSGTATTPPPSAATLTPGPDWVSTGAGASMVGAVTVTNSRYFVPPLPTTGPWTFQVTATNSMGTSTASYVMVNMQGFVPSRPISLAVEVNQVGTFNAEWTASPFGVPAPATYTAGLYGPSTCVQDDTCTTPLLASQTIPAIYPRGPSGVFDLFSLGSNSTPGVYTVVVYGTNIMGNGATARSSILLTPAFIKRLTALQDGVDIADAELPPTLQALNALECSRGLISGALCGES